MSDEDFKAMVDKYYDKEIDNLRLKGHSRCKRPFVSEKCGFPPDVANSSHRATLQRCKGQWPAPHMLDSMGNACLMDGKYTMQGSFDKPPGYVHARESPAATFVFHTSTIYTNVQVPLVFAPKVCQLMTTAELQDLPAMHVCM